MVFVSLAFHRYDFVKLTRFTVCNLVEHIFEQPFDFYKMKETEQTNEKAEFTWFPDAPTTSMKKMIFCFCSVFSGSHYCRNTLKGPS